MVAKIRDGKIDILHTTEQQLLESQKKMRKKIAERRKSRRVGFVTPTPPRYDDVYWQGLKWLNSLD